MLNESRFSTVENEIDTPVITNHLKQLITSFRSQNIFSKGKLAGLTRAEVEKNLRYRVHKEQMIYLGEIYIGRKRINIWIKDIPENALWVAPPKEHKKSSYIIIALNLIINNPQAAVSNIIHEIIHGLQKYTKESPEYIEANQKTSDETAEDWFYYYTEPKELEAQLGQLAHDIVSVFNRRNNKEEILNVLDEILKMPNSVFREERWYQHFSNRQLVRNLITPDKIYFLKCISEPPTSMSNVLKFKQISDRCWRQFKQKLFNLVQELKQINNSRNSSF